MLPRSSLVVNFIAVLIWADHQNIILSLNPEALRLYLQFPLGPKKLDFVAEKHHSFRISVRITVASWVIWVIMGHGTRSQVLINTPRWCLVLGVNSNFAFIVIYF